MKRMVERDTTRPYAMCDRDEIAACFCQAGFRVTNEFPQSFLPMALHRLAKAACWFARPKGPHEHSGSRGCSARRSSYAPIV
jgi:hypothetical protein